MLLFFLRLHSWHNNCGHRYSRFNNIIIDIDISYTYISKYRVLSLLCTYAYLHNKVATGITLAHYALATIIIIRSYRQII